MSWLVHKLSVKKFTYKPKRITYNKIIKIQPAFQSNLQIHFLSRTSECLHRKTRNKNKNKKQQQNFNISVRQCQVNLQQKSRPTHLLFCHILKSPKV